MKSLCRRGGSEKSVRELDVRAKYGVNILGVKESAGRPLRPSVGAGYIFKENMQVMLMGDNASLSKLIRA